MYSNHLRKYSFHRVLFLSTISILPCFFHFWWDFCYPLSRWLGKTWIKYNSICVYCVFFSRTISSPFVKIVGLNASIFVWGKNSEKHVVISTLDYIKARYHGLHHVVKCQVLRKGPRRHHQLFIGAIFVTHLEWSAPLWFYSVLPVWFVNWKLFFTRLSICPSN